MAYQERAYYEQENNFGTIDRLEIHEDGFSGTPIQLEGRFPCAFDFNHRETTSQQRDYLSLFENQIIMGVLDLYARIDTSAKETLVTDIADSTAKQFRIAWKRDGTTVWYGFPYGKVVEFDDMPEYNVKIQFRDFQFLKGEEYPLEDNRQKLEATFRLIIANIALPSTSFPLRTITSWQVENTTTTDDFLNQTYHDTFALRDYASDGYSNDQQISYFEALERAADPMLVLYQWKGVNAFQISGLTDPANVLLSIYTLLGQNTSNSGQDIRQTIHTSVDDGTPASKTKTNNTSYPAIRKVSYEFKHRSGSANFDFDTDERSTFRDRVEFDGNDHYIISKPFSGNGDEKLNFAGRYETLAQSDKALFAVHVDQYILDSDYDFKTLANLSAQERGVDTIDTANDRLDVFSGGGLSIGDPIMFESTGSLPSPIVNTNVYYIIDVDTSGDDSIQISEQPGGSAIDLTDSGSGDIDFKIITIDADTEQYLAGYRAIVTFISGDIPAISSSDMEIILMLNDTASNSDEWYGMNVFIQNPTQSGESIEYRLTQDQLYPDDFEMNDSYFGDGPYPYSKSSYRTSLTIGDTTTGWKRRGESTFVPYSRLKLREVLDFQRVRQRKKQFFLWGEFNPIKVSVFESENYMYVGGTYNGRWEPIMVKIEENLDV